VQRRDNGRRGLDNAVDQTALAIPFDYSDPVADILEAIRYTVHVNGPWCITFEFDGDDAGRVDFERYH